MLTQTSYGQYTMQTGMREDVADRINNFFAQLSWPAEEDGEGFAQLDTEADDGELEDMAEFLAQLDDGEMERLTELVQARREGMGGTEE